MSFLGLVCGFAMSSAQFAPADVPKDHWAYSAVNDLFREGLLDGYPGGKPLRLDPTIAFGQKTLYEDLVRWKASGLLVGYPDGLGRAPQREPSRYEFAVAIYAICSQLKSGAESSEQSMKVVGELPKIARGISMVSTELRRIGADPDEMILGLNKKWPLFKPSFRG